MVPFYAARVLDRGPGDFVQVDCAFGRIERLTAAMLSSAELTPDSKVQDLGRPDAPRRECDEKRRAVISVRWATTGAMIPVLLRCYSMVAPDGKVTRAFSASVSIHND